MTTADKKTKSRVEAANFNERYAMLTQGNSQEKMAAIPYFDTHKLLEVVKDFNSDLKAAVLQQVIKQGELYEIARGHESITTLAYDASPDVRREVMNLMKEYSGRLFLAKNDGNPACDTAYWEFVRAAEKLAVDPVPEIAQIAQDELERHYDRHPSSRPQEVEQEIPKNKSRGMDI